MSDDSLEQPSPLRIVPSCATGDTAMSDEKPSWEWRQQVEALTQQLATARREAWEEAAKLCEQLYDASHDREAVFYEALLTAAHAIRAQAAKEWRSYFAAS